MQKVSDLFEAMACNPCQIANLENGNAGFRIPEYQRPYDWSKENINRLMLDIFAGFERLSTTTAASSFTFLGTLILVRDNQQEVKFKGKSFSIVDGQQRLTSLTLVACALIERLRLLRHDYEQSCDYEKIDGTIKEWLRIESEYLEASLSDCVTGNQKVKGSVFYPFPRVIRSLDQRSDNVRDENLKSGIARFLTEFGRYIAGDDKQFEIPKLDESREAKKVIENYKIIKKYCSSINEFEWYIDNDCQMFESKDFTSESSKQLWEKLGDVLESDGPNALNCIKESCEGEFYLRGLMLASYFCNCVALTTVITDDETAAFDIFDALNTTGEPLTALETLKPQVIAAENKNKKYKGSESEDAFNKIDKLMAEDYPETNQKQIETKDLIITFLLYLEGRKTSRELSSQRSELRSAFQKSLETSTGGTKFIQSLADVARYRSDYWVNANSGRINSHHYNQSEADEVKVLSGFISAMKTSMALPLLSRYWIEGRKSKDFSNYVKALRAVVAFLAIRRAATGGTDGIDNCFREIMEKGNSDKKFGLCAGANHENEILDLDLLKKSLRSKLDSSKVKFSTKEEWINHVVDLPIYAQARPLARFLLFCGTTYTAKDRSEIGLLTREGVTKNNDRKYLSFEHWVDERYLTVEHVAPNSDKAPGWSSGIYENSRIKNTIGNLVLLPSEENSAIGRAAWNKKKTFFAALTAERVSEREAALEEAKKQGMPFKVKTVDIIRKAERFSMLDGVFDVVEWDAEHISKRSHNIASLAWDMLYPWLE